MVYDCLLSIIMQFADDGDLYQKIVEHKKKKQYFEQNEIWTVLIQIVIGLKSLHEFNVLHRDLKVIKLLHRVQTYF